MLSATDYVKLGDKTIPLIIKIGRVWNAQIDEAGYRDRWRGCREDARASKFNIASASAQPADADGLCEPMRTAM